jgi:hypothetical protein
VNLYNGRRERGFQNRETNVLHVCARSESCAPFVACDLWIPLFEPSQCPRNSRASFRHLVCVRRISPRNSAADSNGQSSTRVQATLRNIHVWRTCLTYDSRRTVRARSIPELVFRCEAFELREERSRLPDRSTIVDCSGSLQPLAPACPHTAGTNSRARDRRRMEKGA